MDISDIDIIESIRYMSVRNLMKAAENNYINWINSILKKRKVGLNTKSKYGNTTLMYTSININLETIKLLAENWPDANTQDTERLI